MSGVSGSRGLDLVGFYLTSNHVGFTALDIDRPRIPEVDDEKLGVDLLWPRAPRILEDPPGSIEDLIFWPDTQHWALTNLGSGDLQRRSRAREDRSRSVGDGSWSGESLVGCKARSA